MSYFECSTVDIYTDAVYSVVHGKSPTLFEVYAAEISSVAAESVATMTFRLCWYHKTILCLPSPCIIFVSGMLVSLVLTH